MNAAEDFQARVEQLELSVRSTLEHGTGRVEETSTSDPAPEQSRPSISLDPQVEAAERATEAGAKLVRMVAIGGAAVMGMEDLQRFEELFGWDGSLPVLKWRSLVRALREAHAMGSRSQRERENRRLVVEQAGRLLETFLHHEGIRACLLAAAQHQKGHNGEEEFVQDLIALPDLVFGSLELSRPFWAAAFQNKNYFSTLACATVDLVAQVDTVATEGVAKSPRGIVGLLTSKLSKRGHATELAKACLDASEESFGGLFQLEFQVEVREALVLAMMKEQAARSGPSLTECHRILKTVVPEEMLRNSKPLQVFVCRKLLLRKPLSPCATWAILEHIRQASEKLFMSTVTHVATVWADRSFVQGTDYDLHRHVTGVLYSMVFMLSSEDIYTKGLLAILANGVQVYLENGVVRVRKLGMIIGQAFAQQIGDGDTEPLVFSDLGDNFVFEYDRSQFCERERGQEKNQDQDQGQGQGQIDGDYATTQAKGTNESQEESFEVSSGSMNCEKVKSDPDEGLTNSAKISDSASENRAEADIVEQRQQQQEEEENDESKDKTKGSLLSQMLRPDLPNPDQVVSFLGQGDETDSSKSDSDDESEGEAPVKSGKHASIWSDDSDASSDSDDEDEGGDKYESLVRPDMGAPDQYPEEPPNGPPMPAYLNDCIPMLRSENDYKPFIVAMSGLGNLIRSSPPDLQMSAKELVAVLVGLDNRYSMKGFREFRLDALAALACSPAHATVVPVLTSIVLAKAQFVSSRLDALQALEKAANTLANTPLEKDSSTCASACITDEERVGTVTKTWGRRRTKPPGQVVNKFASLAPTFFFPLFAEPTSSAVLFEREPVLFSQLLQTAGSILGLARNGEHVERMAKTLIELLWWSRFNDQASVRQSTLYCFGQMLIALPRDCMTSDPFWLTKLQQVAEWAKTSSESDADQGCRNQAKALARMLGAV